MSDEIEHKHMGQLWKVCEEFIREQRIGCAETIYQCDWVIENAYEFIERVCEVVGYHKEGDDLPDVNDGEDYARSKRQG